MPTQLEKSQDACTDDCCQEPPGFARAYWIGMGGLFGLIAIAAAINALIS